MTTKALLYTLLCMTVTLTACNSDTPDSGTKAKSRSIEITEAEKAASTSLNRFAWSILEETLYDSKTNTVLSPLSANFCMSMLANAAAGNSRAQILKALGYTDGDMTDVNSLNRKLAKDICKLDPDVTVKVANSFWYDADINPKSEFLNDMARHYDIESFVIRPSTFVQDVNAWCSDKTNGLIPKILKDNELKAFTIINALYFKGFWTKKFNKDETISRAFHNADGSTTDRMFMCGSRKTGCEYYQSDKWHAARLPFAGGGYTFTVFLPYTEYSVVDCIQSISELEPATSEGFREAPLYLMIPKFEVNCETNMIDILKHMGVTDVFTEFAADFSTMTDQDVYVDMVRQQVNFKIDESGAEAAAVTVAGGAYVTALPEVPQYIDFIVDRPFVYMISERSTGAILTLGCINQF